MSLVFEGDTPVRFSLLSKEQFRVIVTKNDMRFCRAETERVGLRADTEEASELAKSHDFFVLFGYTSWFKFRGIVPHELSHETMHTIRSNDHVTFFHRTISQMDTNTSLSVLDPLKPPASVNVGFIR
jgi:hypothetical protein